ncbi:16S rRNA (uracil(1498)-N(3))-methyltransferase [Petroclostridium xylanilyticum]|uniref:16S rRNA (uracil(1498)-N(3))-methyltransferase n=1 Tax=Petroclostridium xylanilyticum TaxID=1792311 RepID=UPI000B9821D7|nr:16S rRNA (uracil(1498)-N(3))-methyltransferase [Petroclostridium xylanilyticum]
MPKFFVEPEKIKGNNIFIHGEDVNHITKVLRLDQNDIIIICDGNGKDYTARIEEVGKKEIKTKILDSSDSISEPPVYVTLYQGIPKAGKMEYIIQKTTELGIGKIVPVITRRTVVKIEDKKSEQNKVERWQKIAYEAAKQSNRGKVPHIAYPINFEEAIKQMSTMDIKLMPYEKEYSNSLKNILKVCTEGQNIGIFIGPEGGFDDDEVRKSQEANLNIVSLGPRILRTETAGAAVLAILMYELGGM